MPPSDTFFAASPHWGWLIVLYFFFGGLAGGSFFLAALADLFGEEQDRPMVRLGYLTAFVAFLPAAPLLIVDLTRPLRFWHMVLQANQLPLPMLKWWSPMSLGTWGVSFFGLFSFLTVLGVLHERGTLGWRPLGLLRERPVKEIVAALGGVMALFLAGYTGVLLSVTNRPIWGDSSLLGLLFLVSAASTAAALLILVGKMLGALPHASEAWLEQFDGWVLWIELAVLGAVLLSLGAVARVWLGGWGLILAVGVVGVGILLPLLLRRRPEMLGTRTALVSAVLVLVGGFLLRAVIVLSSEGIAKMTAGGGG